LDCLKILLNEGADVSAKDESEWTPLHDAAFYGHAMCVREIIAGGRRRREWRGVNAQNDDGDTPLHCASIVGHADCVMELMANGADCVLRNGSGLSAVEVAVQHGHAECVYAMVTCQRGRVKEEGKGEEVNVALLELIRISMSGREGPTLGSSKET
jgi:ankyrin repeat protein